MNQGIRTVIYPVRDTASAKKLFSQLLGLEPHVDYPNYVGYKVGDQEIGFIPNGFKWQMTGPIGYYHVSDIKISLQNLVNNGAQVLQEAQDVGGGRLIAAAKDPDGNIFGLIQDT